VERRSAHCCTYGTQSKLGRQRLGQECRRQARSDYTNAPFAFTFSFLFELLIFGSAVRTLVSVRRSFPALRPIWPKKTGTLFLYALTSYALTSSDIDRLSNLFHCLTRENICNNTVTNTISQHPKCVATLLPCEMSVS